MNILDNRKGGAMTAKNIPTEIPIREASEHDVGFLAYLTYLIENKDRAGMVHLMESVGEMIDELDRVTVGS